MWRQDAGECTEYRQIRRAFEIEHPSLQVGLVVVVEADVRQSLEDLLAPVIHAVWFAYEGNDNIAIGRLIEHDLRMTGRDDLGALL